MKKLMRLCTLLLAAALLLALAACGEPEAKIKLTSEHEGGTLPLVDEVISTYMGLPPEESLDYVRANSYKKTDTAHDGQGVQLSWEGGEAPYTVTIATAEDLSGGSTYTVNKLTLFPGTLYPDTLYYWAVTDAAGEQSAVGSFRTGTGPRILCLRKYAGADGVQNVRDLGGIRAGDATIRYGLLYRGGMFEIPSQTQRFSTTVIDDYGRAELARLGLATELDLRNDSDRGGQEVSTAQGCAYVNVTYTGYTSIFPTDTCPENIYFDTRTPAAMGEIFRLLSKEESYPLYFHCLVGQDRTGTLAYLILGALGVDYEDIVRDYELSAFSRIGEMDRATKFLYSTPSAVEGRLVEEPEAFTALHRMMLEHYGTSSGTLKDAVENYLISECGVTHEELEQLRSILLTK